MMEAAPSAPFEVPEPELLLELLVVALDARAQLGEVDKPAKAGPLRQRREPVFGWLGLIFGPLDQQPLLGQRLRQQVTMTGPHPHACEARAKPIGRALPPSDRTPLILRQIERQLFDRDKLGLVATSRIVQRSATAPRT